MTDDRHLEDEAVFKSRCAHAREEIAQAHNNMVSVALTNLAGDNSQDWADRVYAHLEAMKPRVLALMIVVLLVREVNDDANRLWSQLWTTRSPEDVPL